MQVERPGAALELRSAIFDIFVAALGGHLLMEKKSSKAANKSRTAKKNPVKDSSAQVKAADAESRKTGNRKLTPATLPGKLRRIRLFHGLTQEQMLIIVNPRESDGTNRARISQYEKDIRIPSLIEVYNYARYAGIPAEILLSDDFDLPEKYRRY